MKPTIDSTIALIQKLHQGQADWSGLEYFNHPVAVMSRLPKEASDDCKMIALLHDVVEDCDKSISEILDTFSTSFEDRLQYLKDLGYSDHVTSGVWLLTRKNNGLTYLDEIQNIALSGHVDAMMVKLSDNCENTSPSRCAKLSSSEMKKVASMSIRYENSKSILRDALIEYGRDVKWSHF